MVYREPSPNTCATAALVRVARSKGYLSISGLNMSWTRASRLSERHSRDRLQVPTLDRPANAECNAPPARLRDAVQAAAGRNYVIYGTGH
jgi:hypothetical protein